MSIKLIEALRDNEFISTASNVERFNVSNKYA